MLRILFTASPTRQADEIGDWGKERSGEAVRDRYDLLLAQAVIDLAEAPGRRGVEVINGRIHLVIARVAGDALWVLAYAHDNMVDELGDRSVRGEGEVDRGL